MEKVLYFRRVGCARWPLRSLGWPRYIAAKVASRACSPFTVVKREVTIMFGNQWPLVVPPAAYGCSARCRAIPSRRCCGLVDTLSTVDTLVELKPPEYSTTNPWGKLGEALPLQLVSGRSIQGAYSFSCVCTALPWPWSDMYGSWQCLRMVQVHTKLNEVAQWTFAWLKSGCWSPAMVHPACATSLAVSLPPSPGDEMMS